MRLKGLLPILILLWPFAEIATFIWVGGRVGILGTLGLIVLAGVAGLALVRLQGLRTMREAQRELEAGRAPTGALVRAAMTAAAGLLFLIPGFLSDAAAALLLLPPVQSALLRWMQANMTVVTTAGGARWRTRDGAGGAAGVVDLEPEEFSRRPDSPWSDEAEDRGPPRIGDR